jgi:DNA-binding transcriptional regulator YiaG
LEEKREFWQANDPRELKSLGDRLLAESLPHVESNLPREQISLEVARQRQDLNLELDQLSELLGVTADLLEAWEEDRVKPPESLPFVLQRLGETSPA